MKKILIIGLFAVSLVGCHRTCVCYGFDEQEHRYTEEEVEALHDGNCSNMIYQADTRYLSVCNWE